MQNVLVTGGAGFIGSNFIRYLLATSPIVRITNLDAMTYAGSLENLINLPDPSRHILVQGDITDAVLVGHLLRRYEIDTIVHFAAETHVDRSVLNPQQFIQTNVLGTFTLAEAARQYWLVDQSLHGRVLRFHHISSDEVYGSLKPGEPAWDENCPYAPNSPYAASKAASDHIVRAYGHTYGLPFSITNCSNNYGPYQFPEKLIPLMVLNAWGGKVLPVYGDGQQIRDWLHVADHCEAIYLVITKGKVGETYNIGGGSQPTNLEIVYQLCAILDELYPESPHTPHKMLIQFVADRPGHDQRYAVDFSKIQRELGWKPRHNLGDGLRQTVEWYLDHPQWVSAIQNQPDYQAWISKNYQSRPEKTG